MNQITVPRIATKPVPAFVVEGSPHSMVQAVYDTITLGPPHKMLFAAAVTAELDQYGSETATSIMRRTLGAAVVPVLDGFVFDNAAATTARSAGLLKDVTPIAPATAGGGLAALTTDLAKIAGAMADAGIASEDMMLFCNPRQAIVARGLLVGPQSTVTVVGTPEIAAGSIVGVAPQAVASGFSGAGELEVAKEGLVHMETVPTDIGVSGTLASGSVKSAWQCNLLLQRMRVAGAVQTIASVTW